MKTIMREELATIINSNSKTSAPYLIAQEIISRVNNNKPLTAMSMLENSSINQADLQKFSKYLGFKTFDDFLQEFFLQDSTYFTKAETKDYSNSYQDFNNDLTNMIIDLSKYQEVMIQIANIIGEKKRLFIFSTPENIFLGSEFADRLRFLEIDAHSALLMDKQYFLMNDVKKDDLAIFIISGFDSLTTIEAYNHIHEFAKTFVISVPSKAEKFVDPNFLIVLNVPISPLRVVFKQAGFRYVLEQVFNLLLFHNKEYIDKIVDPKFKV